ncbi:branched-chain amino acid transporter permease [Nocardia brevicatena]|uniref:branched-chain amino acid transporter permease n=1 Tax=Nocardia brevicatena TaxID=37327 RepID=UPI0002DA82AC|nr:AzlD domain-containing protein [Nocardia brevicatena]
MPDIGYLLAVLLIAFAITLTLRAVPFAVLHRVGGSPLARALSSWMPVGILAILAATSLRDAATTGSGSVLPATIAVVVTAAVHLASGRRTLVSIALGTAVYIALLNLF